MCLTLTWWRSTKTFCQKHFLIWPRVSTSQAEGHVTFGGLTLLRFCKTSFILSGWTADSTKMRVTASTLPSGTFSLRSSLVRSHWKARQRSGLYRGLFCFRGQNQFDVFHLTNLFLHHEKNTTIVRLEHISSTLIQDHSFLSHVAKIKTNLDEFNGSRREVAGVDEEIEVLLQQREDAVSNATAGLQQHQPLGFKLQTTQRQHKLKVTPMSTLQSGFWPAP